MLQTISGMPTRSMLGEAERETSLLCSNNLLIALISEVVVAFAPRLSFASVTVVVGSRGVNHW